MVKVIFKYDLNKDVDNFIRGTRAKNSSNPTKLQDIYNTQNSFDYVEFKVEKFLREYIAQISFNADKSIKELESDWGKIEVAFLKRIENIFGIFYPAAEITIYLTTNQRCTYNIRENYFFVNFSSKFPNGTIMHELFHFYTWHAFHEDLIKKGINESKFNDIKESLTELLNIEFADYMEGFHDDGYLQHAEMRKKVKILWEKEKNLSKVLAGII